MTNMDDHSQSFEIKGKVRGLSLFYQDGRERVEIWIDKRYQSSLPARNKQRIPVRLFFNSEPYDAGLRMTLKCPYVWICSNLEAKGKKIRLADILEKYGIKKNETLSMLISENKLIFSNHPK